MNLIDVPDKVTVRLSAADKLNMQCALRDGHVPGYRPTTADAFRIALARMITPAMIAGSARSATPRGVKTAASSRKR
jgi:hypothetical protein